MTKNIEKDFFSNLFDNEEQNNLITWLLEDGTNNEKIIDKICKGVKKKPKKQKKSKND